MECQNAIVIDRVRPGADVTLLRDDEPYTTQCFPAETTLFNLGNETLREGEKLGVFQAFPTCDISEGAPSEQIVAATESIRPASVVSPICARDSRLTINDLTPGAEVTVSLENAGELGMFEAAGTTHEINLPTLPENDRIIVAQKLCGFTSESEPTPIDNGLPSFGSPLRIFDPLHACTTLVRVGGGTVGSRVQVKSSLLGPISDPVLKYSDALNVIVAPALREGDEIFVEESYCGTEEVVGPELVSRLDELPDPQIEEPVYDNTSIFTIDNLITGARVHVRNVYEETDRIGRISRYLENKSFIAHESRQEVRLRNLFRVETVLQVSQHLCNTSSNLVEASVQELPAPPRPLLRQPSDGQTGVSRTPVLRWRDPAAGQENAAVRWRLLPPEGTEIVRGPARLFTEWRIEEPLEYDTEYRWCLTGINRNSRESIRACATFRTLTRPTRRPPPPPPEPVRVSALDLHNCTFRRYEINYWIRNVSRGGAFSELGSQSPQYNDFGTCPAGAAPFRIELPNDGDIYEVVAVAPDSPLCGVNDPSLVSCRKFWVLVTADSSAQIGSYAVT